MDYFAIVTLTFMAAEMWSSPNPAYKVALFYFSFTLNTKAVKHTMVKYTPEQRV
jgi:hypothetical protein